VSITTSKHTPGPWFVADGGIRPAIYAKDGSVLIAEMADTGDEYEANARVAAAAPVMLAALARIKVVMDGIVHPGCRRPDDALSEVEAALSAALGISVEQVREDVS
jgi:hypothetical protein